MTVHRGARDGYQVARALEEVGLLETLVTDLYWPSDRRWAQGLERLSPRQVSQALRCRNAVNLSSKFVRSCWASGISSLLASKVRWLPFDLERSAARWCDQVLGDRAGQLATETGSALLSYSYYGYNSFSQFRGDGPRILFQLHPHPSSVRTILQNELRRSPECRSSLDKEWELALPEIDFQRLVQEVSMAEHWMVASNFTKKTLVENGVPTDRIAVVPYGIDRSIYFGTPRVKAKKGPLKLLFVGTLTQRKGIKYLVEALDLLPPGSVELTVCGRPVDDLQTFRNSSSTIHLFPSICTADLLQAYRAADVFVFPSLAEGFGQVLLEAMASGLPTISTENTAAPDLIDHGQEGFVIRPGSASELAAHIEEFLRNPDLLSAMSEGALKRAEYFSWARFRRGVTDFVRNVAN